MFEPKIDSEQFLKSESENFKFIGKFQLLDMIL